MNKKYLVQLTAVERQDLEAMLCKGEAKAMELRRARILLKADRNGPAWADARIAEAFDCCRQAVENLRQRFAERGIDCIRRKPQERPSRQRKLDGRAEARLLTLACGEAPDGRERWTLRLLADRAVVLGLADELSYETVRRTLKKAN